MECSIYKGSPYVNVRIICPITLQYFMYKCTFCLDDVERGLKMCNNATTTKMKYV